MRAKLAGLLLGLGLLAGTVAPTLACPYHDQQAAAAQQQTADAQGGTTTATQ